MGLGGEGGLQGYSGVVESSVLRRRTLVGESSGMGEDEKD